MRIDWKYCENAKDLWRNRKKNQEELWPKNHTINQEQLFSVDIFHWPFSFPKFDLLSGTWEKKNCKRKSSKIKFMNMPEQSQGESESETAKNIAFRGIIWFKKSFQEQKNKKLFQFAKIAHQSKTEFPQTISRKRGEKRGKFSCAFNQCYEVIYVSCLRIQSEYIFLCDLNEDMSSL
jgi:hypothetical protein